MKYIFRVSFSMMVGAVTLTFFSIRPAVASNSGAAPVAHVFPQEVAQSEENTRFFQMGKRAAKDSTSINVYLDEFERDIEALYADLARALGTESTDGQRLAFFDELGTQFQIRLARAKLLRAELALLTHMGIANGNDIVTPQTFYRGKSVAVYSSASFQHFLHGLYKGSGRYISVENQIGIYGSAADQIRLQFPKFCFNSVGEEHVYPVPERVRKFLASSSSYFDSDRLYDTSVTSIRETVIQDSRSYGQTGFSKSCGHFGEVAAVGGERHIFIFSRTMREDRYFQKYAAQAPLLEEEKRTHELMHYLLLPNCQLQIKSAPSLFGGQDIHPRQFNEAQATLASLAIFARTHPDSLMYVLATNMSLTSDPSYSLVYDAFFRGLFRDLVRRKLEELSAVAALGDGSKEFVLPKYLGEVDSIPASGTQADPSVLYAEFPSRGQARKYIVNLDRATFAEEWDLLFSATPEDVIAAANEGLGKLSSACSAHPTKQRR